MSGRATKLRRALAGAALVVVVGALAYCGWFRLAGGHWERVETPSMGATAPVGTLLWVEPTNPAHLVVGDVVSFHAPGHADGPVYSHRIAVVNGDGTFGTAGDLSGPDAWQVGPDDVVGRVVHIWPGVGWLVAVSPVLVLGGGLGGALVMLVRRSARLPLGLVAASLTLAAALVVYQPLAGAELISVDQGQGQVTAKYVSTGMLPITISTPGGESTEIGSGETGTLTVHSSGGKVDVKLVAQVPVWLWALLLVICFGPSIGTSLVGRPAPTSHRHRRLAALGAHAAGA